MSSQARTHRVHSTQVLISWRIIESPGGVADRRVGLGGDATAVDDEAGHAVKITPGAVRGNPKCLPHRAVWTCLKRDRAGRGPARWSSVDMLGQVAVGVVVRLTLV